MGVFSISVISIHKSLHIDFIPMETIFLYGLSADDADKRELADNRRDEEEAVEVEGSDRVKGWGIGVWPA